MTFDPTRLTDPASSASPSLRELLRSADGDGPSAAQLQRLTERLAPQLGPPPAPAVASATTSGGVGVAGGAVATVVVIAGLVVGGVFWFGRSPEPRPASVPAITVAAPTREIAPPPAQEGPRVEPAPAPIVATPPRRRPAPAVAPPVIEVPAPVTSTADAEVALLGEAKRALRAGDARNALALTEEHDLNFPSGVLVEEREAIAIEALITLGRGADAGRRLDRFRTSYPRSGYRPRLERLLTSRE